MESMTSSRVAAVVLPGVSRGFRLVPIMSEPLNSRVTPLPALLLFLLPWGRSFCSLA